MIHRASGKNQSTTSTLAKITLKQLQACSRVRAQYHQSLAPHPQAAIKNNAEHTDVTPALIICFLSFLPSWYLITGGRGFVDIYGFGPVPVRFASGFDHRSGGGDLLGRQRPPHLSERIQREGRLLRLLHTQRVVHLFGVVAPRLVGGRV